MEELREKQLIWRPGYGSYALENAEIRRLLMDDWYYVPRKSSNMLSCSERN